MPIPTWENKVNVVESAGGATLTKNAGGTSWNAGASSVESCPVGVSCEVSFQAGELGMSKLLGLGYANIDENYGDIEFSLHPHISNVLYILESGATIGTYGTYTTNDIFKVEYTGTEIKYYKNAGLLYTSLITPNATLFVDTAFYAQGSSITNINFSLTEITIDWPNKIINIPKSVMSLVQSNPTEIKELDLNVFRLTIKDLEDNENGIIFTKTHNHNPPFTVGGVELARTVEIVNDYTVTFEDGQYAVNLVGANSNVGDRVNVNQVSVRTANSAGLVTSAAIEFGEYGGKVTIDATNGESGTIYPIGTSRRPVNNLDDAVFIAGVKGFSTLYFTENWTFTTATNISDLTIMGAGLNNVFTFEDGSNLASCTVEHATCIGLTEGVVKFNNCRIDDLGSASTTPSSVNLSMHNCLFINSFTIPSNYSGIVTITDSWSESDVLQLPPVIDHGNSTASIQIRNHSGIFIFDNVTNDIDIRMFLTSGGAVLNSSITDGDFLISGVGFLTNNSTSLSALNIDGLINKETVAVAVEDHIGDLRYRIESLRRRSPATGKTIFYDPVNGNDGNDGLYEATPVLTFAQAHTLAGDGIHDVIYIIDIGSGGDVPIDDQWVITKKDITVRGAGQDIILYPTATSGYTIDIQAEECVLDNFQVRCADTGTGSCIRIGSSNLTALYNIKIKRSWNNGVEITNSDGVLVKDCIIEHHTNGTGHAVLVNGDSHECNIISNFIYDTVTGISFEGTANHNGVERNTLHDNVTGINIGSGCVDIMIHDSNILANNTTDIADAGTGTYYKTDDTITKTVNAILPSINRNADLIESQRGSHTQQGDYYYVAPTFGNDTTGDGTKALPYKTVTKALTDVTDSNHDVIFLISDNPAGPTTLTEDVTIDKRYVFIRGPGRDFVWDRTGSGSTIIVTADGVEISGVQINTDTIGVGCGVDIVSADFIKVINCWINDTTGDGVCISNSSNCQILDNIFQGSGTSGAGHGLKIDGTGGSSDNIVVKNNHFDDVQGHGINLTAGNTNQSIIQNNTIHDCTGYGIRVDTSSTGAFIADNRIGNNTLGDILNDGVNTIELFNASIWEEAIADHNNVGTFGEKVQSVQSITTTDKDEIADKVWDEVMADHTTAGTTGEKQNTGGSGDPDTIADAVWDEANADHNDPDTMGEKQNQVTPAIPSAGFD